MSKSNGRTTDKAMPGAQTRPAEADTKREGASATDAERAKPAAADAPAEETDQSQGGGNPHVPIAASVGADARKDAGEGAKDTPATPPKADTKPTKAQSQQHDADHATAEFEVLRPICENGRMHQVGERVTLTHKRARGIGEDNVRLADKPIGAPRG